jgi:hypothetical protein
MQERVDYKTTHKKPEVFTPIKPVSQTTPFYVNNFIDSASQPKQLTPINNRENEN